MKHYDVIDEAGDVCSTFDLRKDADLYVADNSEHKLEVIEIEITPCSQEISS